MRRAVPLLVLLMTVLAGCSSGDGATPAPTPTSESPPPPKQVLAKDNEGGCPEAFQGASWEFTVDAGYDQIHVEFHTSGAGQAGLKIRDAAGKDVFAVPAAPVSSEPCAHAHEGGALPVDIAPGPYKALLEGQGVLGYHLVIVEVSSKANATSAHH